MNILEAKYNRYFQQYRYITSLEYKFNDDSSDSEVLF